MEHNAIFGTPDDLKEPGKLGITELHATRYRQLKTQVDQLAKRPGSTVAIGIQTVIANDGKTIIPMTAVGECYELEEGIIDLQHAEGASAALIITALSIYAKRISKLGLSRSQCFTLMHELLAKALNAAVASPYDMKGSEGVVPCRPSK